MTKWENIWSIVTSYQVGIFNCWWWKDVRRKVSSFCFPRQRWLTSKIPNEWVDKDTLWETCILEGIKHHVEKDGGLDFYLESQNDPSYPEHQKKLDKELQEMYDLTVKTLPRLEAELEVMWDKIPSCSNPLKAINNGDRAAYDAIYGNIDRKEREIAELKTKIMVWAVTYREYLWT